MGHWDIRAQDSRQLVYISSYEQPVGRYSVELESAPAQGSEAPYQTVGNFELLSREELLDLITKHLELST
jgi:hypothetical protein